MPQPHAAPAVPARRRPPRRTSPVCPGSSVGPSAAAAAGIALALVAAPAALQAQQQEVRVTATHVAGSVYMLQGQGGNIGVSMGEDGAVMVDDQFARLAPKIRGALDSLGATPLTFVLNTHWHGDHTGGNEVFGREAPVIAHDNVRTRLANPQVIRGDTIPASPEEALPVLTFDRSVTLHVNGEAVEVKHFPRGHTDGDAVVFFTGSNVVHMGDHMFAGRFPFVDLASGGTVQGYARNVGEVLERLPPDARVIPGHGPLTDVQGLEAFHTMLVETTELVRSRMEEGMSLEEVKAEGLPSRWDGWGEGFISTDQWLETVYRSLQRGRDRASGGPGTRGGDADAADGHFWHPHGHGPHSGGHGHGAADRPHGHGADAAGHGHGARSPAAGEGAAAGDTRDAGG